MVIQQRNNSKNFPNNFTSTMTDGTNEFSFCNNCKIYFDAPVGSGSGHLWNLVLHMINEHGYTDGG